MMCLTLMGVKFNALNAQNVVTIDGTKDGFESTTNENYPFNTNYRYTTSQQFYRAEELCDIKQGDIITSIAFKIKASKVNPLDFTRSLTIYMINTEDYKFTSKNPKLMTDDDLVFNGDVKFDATEKWFTINTSDFEYEGKNILVCVVDKTNIDLNNNTNFYAFKAKETDGTNITRGIYKRDTKLHDPTSESEMSISYSTGANINQIQFGYKTSSSGGGDDTTVSPTAVTNVSPSNNTIYGSNPQELTWTFGDNTTQYQVLVGTEKEDGENGRVINTLGQQDFVEKGEGNNGSYSAEGLSAGTQYCWQVISKNENGETAGDIWYFTTVSDVEPTAMVTKTYPENGAFVKINAVKLQWQYNNDNHDRYTIYLGESATDMPVLATGIDNITEYTPDNLHGEKTYYWRVDVNNAIYTSEDTEVWSFTTQSVGNIDGIVMNNDVFVSGATISIKDLNGNLVGSTTTAGSGNFAFNDVVIGEYYLYIEVEGMETYTLELNVEAGKTTSLGTIYLPSIIATDDSWNITNAELSEFNELIVRANAVLQTTAKVGSLTIESGKSVTIKDGAVLTVVGKINNNGEIIIEDGGQIYQNNEDVYATFKMNVENPEEWLENNTTGWQFISSPFVDATVASFIPSEGEYDLYKYDGKQELEWVNHKGENSGGSGESGDTFYYDFNDASVDDWTKIDADGDGKNWGVTSSGIYAGYEESVGLYSSCYAGDELYPDNYFVTNKTYAITSTSFLSFLHHTSDALYTEENFGVVVSENGTDWIVIWSKKYDYNAPDEDWQEANVSLADYAGKNVYLGFRHYNCNGSSANGIRIDNVRLSSGSRNQTRGTSSFEETFAQGVGYLASYETEETATLSGNLFNEDNFTFKVSYNEDKDIANFHLLGNPFPFNMDWSNISLEGVYDGFATVDPATGGYITATEGAIPVGDGFFVKATAANPRISYATASKSRGKKSEYINVVATGKQGSNNVIIKLDGEEKVGFAKLNNINPSIADVYVKNNDRQYSILSYDRNITEVELFFNAKEIGSYSISVKPNGKFESVTLVDRITGIETNMLLENEYSFTATSNDNPNRFVIRLDNGQQTTDNGQFVYRSGEELILSIEGSVQIVDMLGRVVYSNEHSNGNNRISVSEFNNAAYVIRVVNEEGVKTQKVVIY